MPTSIRIKAQDLDASLLADLKSQFGNAEMEIRVHEVPDTAGMLTEAVFWGLIDDLDWQKTDNEAIIKPIVEVLSTGSIANIYQFQDILSERLWLLDTRAHAEAFEGSSEGAISVDAFLSARCGVVAEGKSYFDHVLAHPAEMPRDLDFSPLLRVARMAYERKTGKKMTILPAFNYETFGNKQGWK